ncbi:MAG: ribosome biogenesis GTP-binding protein YihA/YsxC, partial [Leuconostoc mesenteroides]
DKISRSRFNKYESNIKRTLGFDEEDSDFQFFSSETKYGKDEVWQWIEARLNQM